MRSYLLLRKKEHMRFSTDEDDGEVYDRGKTHVNDATQVTDSHQGDEKASQTVMIPSSDFRNADEDVLDSSEVNDWTLPCSASGLSF